MKQEKKRGVLPYFLLIAALVGLDQLVKWLIRTNIPLYGSVDLIPRMMDLTYVQNTGAAFSIFSTHTWALALLSAVVSAGLVYLLIRSARAPFLWKSALSLVIAGAVGNLIDRAFLGFVTDMFRTLFIDFAVFNVADICITVGGVLCAVYMVFFAEKKPEEQEDTAHGGGHAEG